MSMSVTDRLDRQRGFTLVELMITVTVMAILMLAAAPSIRTWIFNTRVRTSAEALQNGLRLAQAEAVRQNRQVAFTLTGASPDWTNWQALTLPSATGAAGGLVRAGPTADVVGGVLTSVVPDTAQVVCFSSLGNLVANTTTASAATGANCAAGAVTYEVRHPNADRRLQVQVSISGRVRMCDPTRSLATEPDGCT